MVDIIRLYGDPHEQAQALLPWYVTGALTPDERGAVAAHLEECAECRQDLAEEQALAKALANLPDEQASGRAARPRPPRREGPDRRSPAIHGAGILRRRISVGAALMAQAAMLVVVVGLAWALSLQPRPAYRALGAAPAAAAGNIVVIFDPATSEQELRTALVHSGARIVDGPTASDAFILRAPAQERAAALARLKANPRIVMAEPLDGDPGR